MPTCQLQGKDGAAPLLTGCPGHLTSQRPRREEQSCFLAHVLVSDPASLALIGGKEAGERVEGGTLLG